MELSRFEKKIEFDAIRDMVVDFCISPMGRELAGEIGLLDDLAAISRLLDETMEFAGILGQGGSFPAQDYFDLRPELQRLEVEGAFITLEHMFDLRTSLRVMDDITGFVRKYKATDINLIRSIVEGLEFEPWILERLEAVMDDRGVIRDNASPELASIRKKIAQKGSAVNRKIAQNLKAAKQQGWIAGDAEVTLRDGRQVIPVPATHKRRIPGTVIDESATGQTVYIEPAEVLEITNEIRELMNAERREIVRILRQFSDELRPEIPVLLVAYQELGRIDFIRARARLTRQLKATRPNLVKEPGLDWEEAYHPLLYLSHQRHKKEVIPLSITLDKEKRILVISGPNAGGKSVCLKTVGLLQYMVQCGLPVPVRDGSTSGIFTRFFIDIGDEQSLENDLSTYSSHLLNMKELVSEGNGTTLFLIDEFGTGTEPRLGGAIAEAVLETLNDRKCYGVVTTHYSNLKLLAGEGSGIVNGAMLFDTARMEPLYQLSIGKPGSSFAFEIARKIGFPEMLLQKAEAKTGKEQLDFDVQLQQLDAEKRALEKKHREFDVADSFLSEMISKYESLKSDLDSRKQKIIDEAREEARQLIESSNRLIEQTIREIRESQADRERTQMLRRKLASAKENLEKAPGKKEPQPKESGIIPGENEGKAPLPDNDDITVGDTVQVRGQDVRGEVTEVLGDDLVIGFNSITFRTTREKVEKIPAPAGRKKTAKPSGRTARISASMNDKLANFRFQLDVRGMRGDEAVGKVQHYLDDAAMLRISEVRILHGKGHGILRTLIHEYLRSNPEVRQFRDEHIERGGHGITIVILK